MYEEVTYCSCMYELYYWYFIRPNVAIQRLLMSMVSWRQVTSFVLGYFLVRIGSGVGTALGVIGLGFGMGA